MTKLEAEKFQPVLLGLALLPWIIIATLHFTFQPASRDASPEVLAAVDNVNLLLNKKIALYESEQESVYNVEKDLNLFLDDLQRDSDYQNPKITRL